jgi:hypothetical protein
VHPLETVKAKGEANQYKDALFAVADTDHIERRFFRLPTDAEHLAATELSLNVNHCSPYPAIPDELIPPGNVHTVMASGYGYRTFGELMCDCQTRVFIETAAAIASIHKELITVGISRGYAAALA